MATMNERFLAKELRLVLEMLRPVRLTRERTMTASRIAHIVGQAHSRGVNALVSWQEATAVPAHKHTWDKAPDVVEVYISAPGDPSVGIKGCSVTIRDDSGQDFLGLDGIADEYQVGALEDFRRGLREVFTECMGEPVHIVFDFECKDECEQMEGDSCD